MHHKIYGFCGIECGVFYAAFVPYVSVRARMRSPHCVWAPNGSNHDNGIISRSEGKGRKNSDKWAYFKKGGSQCTNASPYNLDVGTTNQIPSFPHLCLDLIFPVSTMPHRNSNFSQLALAKWVEKIATNQQSVQKGNTSLVLSISFGRAIRYPNTI